MARGKRKKKGYRQSVYQDNSQHLPTAAGWLKKRSPQGLWQRRRFVLNNHYLVYYKDEACTDLRGSIDLVDVEDARAVSRFGDIDLVMRSGEVYPLKCVEERQTALWVQAIKARIEYYSRASVSERPSEVMGVEDEVRESESTAQEKTGWLLKRSPHRHNKFQERFVRLGQGALQYFKKATDQQPQGVIPLDGLSFVRAFNADPSCVTFELRYEDRTFVFNAQTNAEMMGWVQAIEHHWEEAQQLTEAAKQQAILMATPALVRRFDEVGADVFVSELRNQVLQFFNVGSSVAEIINSLNQALELLEDVIADCELVCAQPVRADIMAASLRCVHDCMEIHLSPLLAKSALSEMSLEDLYNLIDWIGAHHAQIRRLARHIPQAELPSFTIYNDIPRLCELYLHGPKGSSKMMHEHVQRILTQTTTKRHEAISSKEDGKVFTHAPIDIWEMLHQHLSLATNTQCETLHVMIIHEIGKALVSVAKTLEDYLDPILAPSKGNQHQKQQEEESQQEGLLEFLCAIANDMVVHTTEIADVVADFEADEIKDKLDEAMDKAVQSLLECGQLAVSKLAKFVMLDTETMLQAVYSTAWLKASNMDVVAATAQDYLNDMTAFLSTYWSNKVENAVLLEVVVGYGSAIVTAARSRGMKPLGGIAPQPAIAQLCLDIETFRQGFSATISQSLVDAYLQPLQDIASILSAPADELPELAAEVAGRGTPLDTLVVKIIQQLYPLRDDSQRRKKTERERVLAECTAAVGAATTDIDEPDRTRTSAVFKRLSELQGPTKGLITKLTRNLSAKSETSNRLSSMSRDSNDSDEEAEDESNKLLQEILELARKTDRHVEGATDTVPFQGSDEDALDDSPGTKSLRSGMMQKLSKRQLWITRWFDLLAITTEPNKLIHILGWSKKQSQQDYTATCFISDIEHILVLQCPRAVVYVQDENKLVLKVAAQTSGPYIDVVTQGQTPNDSNSTSPSNTTMQGAFDFAIKLRDRSDDMVLRVKSVDDMVEWINAIAAAAKLSYNPTTSRWDSQQFNLTSTHQSAAAAGRSAMESAPAEATTSTSKSGLNPKARMKNRVKAGSLDKTTTSSSPPPIHAPQRVDDFDGVVSPFHAPHSPAPSPNQSPSTQQSKHLLPRSTEGAASSRASGSSFDADGADMYERFTVSISSNHAPVEVDQGQHDDGRVVEMRSSWCCWR